MPAPLVAAQAANVTSAVTCDRGRIVLAVGSGGEEGVVWELAVGAGVLRLVGAGRGGQGGSRWRVAPLSRMMALPRVPCAPPCRQVGYDFSSGGFSRSWPDLGLAQRLQAAASLAAALPASQLPPPGPATEPPPPRCAPDPHMLRRA